MTAHQITISNSLRAFGGSPPSLWNAHNWNAFKWGDGTVKVPWQFVHLVDADDLALDSARYFRLTKLVDAESFTLDSSVNFSLTRLISNTLDLVSDSAHQYVTDAAGYYRLFPGGGTDGETRVSSAWTQGSAGSSAWTSGTVTSTVWSAA